MKRTDKHPNIIVYDKQTEKIKESRLNDAQTSSAGVRVNSVDSCNFLAVQFGRGSGEFHL